MTTEEKLKAFILTKYRSIREFTQTIDMPYSTMTSILKKGVQNSSVQNVIRICQALNISTDALAEGNIVPNTKETEDAIRIEDILFHTKEMLTGTEHLTFEGKPASKEDIYLIISTIDTAMEIRKKQNERLAAYYNNLMKDDK